MADDDHNQRTFHTNERPERNMGPANHGGPSDPLAELARLIGQSDPFGEFGRAARGRTAPPGVTPRTAGPAAPEQGGNAYLGEPPTAPEPAAPPTQPVEPDDLPPPYARRFPGDAPSRAGADHFASEEGVGRYAEEGAAHYEHDHYEPSQGPFESVEEEFYEEAPPRRRVGFLAIAAVFGLAVIGGAGAFGYRVIFGPSSSGPPPVIKADTAPSKIPAPNKKTQSANNDRINDQAEGDKLVSREEQPVDIRDRPSAAFPQPPRNAPSNAAQLALGSGIIAGVGEPRKVHTIVIHPEESTANPAAVSPPAAPPPAAAPPETQATMVTAPEPAPTKHVASSHSPAKPKPVAHHTVARTANPELEHHRVAAAQSSHTTAANAPLSLSPSASMPAAPVQTTRAPMRTAAVAPPTQIEQQTGSHSSSAGGYAVQISSRHSKADAEAAFRRLQAKFPSQLGGREPLIRRVDLGSKGVYYRAMVGPFASSAQASQLCSSLKAAGGSCFVQRI